VCRVGLFVSIKVLSEKKAGCEVLRDSELHVHKAAETHVAIPGTKLYSAPHIPGYRGASVRGGLAPAEKGGRLFELRGPGLRA
jgi:hypothetical protein